MKHNKFSITSVAILCGSLVIGTVSLLVVSRCCGSEVSYLEKFDTTSYAWVSTTEHARFSDWLNGDLSTARSNGVLRIWGNYAPYKPANPLANVKSIVMNRSGEIWPGREVELRADVLRLSGDGAYAAIGWQQEGLYEMGYLLLKGAAELALVKHRFDRQIFAPLFWEPLPTTASSVTLVLRFSATQTNLTIAVQVVDLTANGQVVFDRTVVDSANADSVATAPARFAASPDSGPPWQGSGRLCLSLFGVNTNSARLEMDVDNFGMRQTSGVTENEFLPQVYTNAPGQTLAYRLFIPPHLEPGALYPLVLQLHSLDGVGDDNLKQFNHPGALVFTSPENQARHPCFLVAPQVSTKDYNAYGQSATIWGDLRLKVSGLLTNLMTQFPIDRERLYVTGGSLGGIGTWSLITAYPDLFAAAVPIAGMADTATMKRITHLPIWTFHGARDKTIGVDATRGLVTELRCLGTCPIYTEYASASHDMFAAAYETPGLVDWTMAQRRGTPALASPWISISTPTTNGVWLTSYTNQNLAGAARLESGLTNVGWRNQTANRLGPAMGTTNWAAAGIPLHLGQTTDTGISASTNVITITATGTNGSDQYGGTTTCNATLRIVQVPIRLQVSCDPAQARLGWSGAAPSFVVQRCTDLGLMAWEDVMKTSETNLALPRTMDREFYRIRLP